MPATRHLLLTRPGFESALCEEAEACRWKAGPTGTGLVLLEGEGELSSRPWIFERQRLPCAGFIPLRLLKPIQPETAEQVFAPLLYGKERWVLHALFEEQGPETLKKRIRGVTAALLRVAGKKDRRLEARCIQVAPSDETPVLQCLLTEEGLWYSVAPLEDLSSPAPGGVVRMKRDGGAPSRSYLKLEEALDRMNLDPQPGERALDLGAAPGGWSYSFLRRGCDVMAVDRGPMKLPKPGPDWGSLTHLRKDGIGFEPPRAWRPTEYLVSDMLVAPGVALGLLRKWLGERWMHYIICNIKIPQQHPYVAVRPVIELLEKSINTEWSVRQLFHDRREVTVMIRLGTKPPRIFRSK